MSGRGPPVGIDLGTTNSCVAVFRDGRVEIIHNEHGNRVTPSCVAFTDHERLVGDAAMDQALIDPENTIFDAKRLIGRKFSDEVVQNDMKHWPFKVVCEGDRPKIQATYLGEVKTFFPEEISSMVLAKMKATAEDYLECKVTDAVITVPAYFRDAQRQATKDAARIAGLNVLRIINEPTAAALAYGLDQKSQVGRHILIYDFGGGTFDVSILTLKDGVFKVLATAGDTHLGGADIDNLLVDHFVAEFKRHHKKDPSSHKKAIRRLRRQCEVAKKRLSSIEATSFEINLFFDGIDFSAKITRAEFNDLCRVLFESTLTQVENAINDAKIDKMAIDDIVLVGGSSRIPRVQELLKEFFNGKELRRGVHQDEVVAHGAAIQAAILAGDRSETVKDLVLLDVAPLSLGVELVDKSVSVLIKRNTTIPVRVTKKYCTAKDGQTAVRCSVFEGERLMAKDNNFLGEFKTTHPPAPRYSQIYELTFEVDANGILTASETETLTHNRNSMVITSRNNLMSEAEIERLVREAEMFRERDEAERRRISARNRFFDRCFDLKKTLKDNSPLPKSISSPMLDEVTETFVWSNLNDDDDDTSLYQIRRLWEQP